jgi:hypothetical protein
MLLLAILVLAGVELGLVNPSPAHDPGASSPLVYQASTKRKSTPIPATLPVSVAALAMPLASPR